jgi:hypothetical protein
MLQSHNITVLVKPLLSSKQKCTKIKVKSSAPLFLINNYPNAILGDEVE